MPCSASVPIVFGEILTHCVTSHLNIRASCKTSRYMFHSTTPVHHRLSSTASDTLGILGRETISTVDEAYVPFHRTSKETQPHQRCQHDLRSKYAYNLGHSETRFKRNDEIGAQSRGKMDKMSSTPPQSCHLIENRGVRSIQQRMFAVTKNPRPELYSKGATSPNKGGRALGDISSSRSTRDELYDTEAERDDSRDFSLVTQEQVSNQPSGASESDLSHRKFPRPSWQAQKEALALKFGSSGWSPRKRLSPDALEGIRSLHSQYPYKYPTPVLAEHFQVSPEAIRRILKSRWRPSEEEEEERRERWDKRGEIIWRQMVEIGIKPPKKWREMGLRKTKTRSTGVSVDGKSSIRDHLLGALKYRRVPDCSNVESAQKRVPIPPAPLSHRIL